MTTLELTPNWQKKTAKFKGTVAAGELVAVTVQNDDTYVASTTNLRLRVVDPICGRTLAVFPQPVEEGEMPETWSVDIDTGALICELNLNTIQMLKAVPPAATVPLLFVLDDKDADTLYFKDMCDVTHWPMELGEDVPYDLAGYPDFVEEAKEAIAEAQQAIEAAVDEATGIVEQAKEARTLAQGAASDATASALAAGSAQTAAENAVTDAQSAQTAAETAQAAAETAQGKAEDAQEAAETAQAAAEAALPLDTTLSNSGKAADAKAVGDALELKANASGVYNKSEVDTKVAQEAQLRLSADSSLASDISTLSSSKADKSEMSITTGTGVNADKTTIQLKDGTSATVINAHQSLESYVTGAEYDSTEKKIYLKHGSTRLSNPVDATAFIKDGMVSSVEITGGNLVITFNTDAGQEPITIPLTDIFDPNNYYDRETINTKLLGKADKKVPSEAGNFAGLDADGSLIDSEKKASDFANVTHNHTASQITDLGTAATKNVPTSGDASTTQVVLGSDTRLGNARTPTAHASSHAIGGSDPITPSLIGAATKADATLTERTGWDLDGLPSGAIVIDGPTYFGGDDGWMLTVEYPSGVIQAASDHSNEDAKSLVFEFDFSDVTAVKKEGYQLGPNDGLNANKSLASEAEAKALRTNKEDVSNKTTEISAESTDAQYPSAKAVYVAIQQGGGQTDIGLSVVDGLINVTFEN